MAFMMRSKLPEKSMAHCLKLHVATTARRIRKEVCEEVQNDSQRAPLYSHPQEEEEEREKESL
jgi:hypothetical protein